MSAGTAADPFDDASGGGEYCSLCMSDLAPSECSLCHKRILDSALETLAYLKTENAKRETFIQQWVLERPLLSVSVTPVLATLREHATHIRAAVEGSRAALAAKQCALKERKDSLSRARDALAQAVETGVTRLGLQPLGRAAVASHADGAAAGDRPTPGALGIGLALTGGGIGAALAPVTAGVVSAATSVASGQTGAGGGAGGSSNGSSGGIGTAVDASKGRQRAVSPKPTMSGLGLALAAARVSESVDTIADASAERASGVRVDGDAPGAACSARHGHTPIELALADARAAKLAMLWRTFDLAESEGELGRLRVSALSERDVAECTDELFGLLNAYVCLLAKLIGLAGTYCGTALPYPMYFDSAPVIARSWVPGAPAVDWPLWLLSRDSRPEVDAFASALLMLCENANALPERDACRALQSRAMYISIWCARSLGLVSSLTMRNLGPRLSCPMAEHPCAEAERDAWRFFRLLVTSPHGLDRLGLFALDERRSVSAHQLGVVSFSGAFCVAVLAELVRADARVQVDLAVSAGAGLGAARELEWATEVTVESASLSEVVLWCTWRFAAVRLTLTPLARHAASGQFSLSSAVALARGTVHRPSKRLNAEFVLLVSELTDEQIAAQPSREFELASLAASDAGDLADSVSLENSEWKVVRAVHSSDDDEVAFNRISVSGDSSA